LEPVRFILRSHQFWNGLVAGLLAGAIIAVAATLARRRQLAVAGLAFAIAAFIALVRSRDVIPVAGHGHVPYTLALGGALAFVLPVLARRVNPGIWLAGLAVAPGAIVTAGSLVGVETWIRVVVAGFCIVGGAGIADYEDRHAARGYGPVMWLITVGAIYTTVPDTEAALVLLGVAVPIAFLGWPAFYARLGPGGAAAGVCILGWVLGQDGAGRAGAVVGGAATLGLFVLDPVVHRVRAHMRDLDLRATPMSVGPTWAGPIAHFLCALAAARWAGLAHDASTACLRLAVILPFAVALTLWADDDATEPHRAPQSPLSPAPRRR
jgi:uncharacterized membrane protein (UPF0136 family)